MSQQHRAQQQLSFIGRILCAPNDKVVFCATPPALSRTGAVRGSSKPVSDADAPIITLPPWLEALYFTSVMPRLDQEALRRYARRDWLAPARRARVERAHLPIERKVQLAIELYEAAKATRPGWPDEATRRADLDDHLRLKAKLDRAAHVGAR